MRTFSEGLQSILSGLASPKFAVIVSFSTLAVRYTSTRSAVSYSGETYSPAQIVVEGLSENLLGEVPSATLRIDDLDSTERARFFADEFRGDRVTIRILYDDAGTWTDTGFVLTLTADADEADDKAVTLRLASSDAAQGMEVPRRTTLEAGCQFVFRGEGCPFRTRQASANMSAALRDGCDRTYHGPLGCRAHFPDGQIGGTVYVTPKPFGGFPGQLARRLLLGGA